MSTFENHELWLTTRNYGKMAEGGGGGGSRTRHAVYSENSREHIKTPDARDELSLRYGRSSTKKAGGKAKKTATKQSYTY